MSSPPPGFASYAQFHKKSAYGYNFEALSENGASSVDDASRTVQSSLAGLQLDGDCSEGFESDHAGGGSTGGTGSSRGRERGRAGARGGNSGGSSSGGGGGEALGGLEIVDDARDEPRWTQQGAAQYATLGERVSNHPKRASSSFEYYGGRREHIAWDEMVRDPPERPSTAPLPMQDSHIVEARRERAEQHNIALLIASMQELTAVVSRHGEEIRELRDAQHRDARCSLDAYDAARSASATAREHAERSASALERIDARLEQLELTVFTRSTARMQANSVSQNAPQRRPEQQQQLQQQQQQRAHQLCSPDDFAAAAREPSADELLYGRAEPPSQPPSSALYRVESWGAVAPHHHATPAGYHHPHHSSSPQLQQLHHQQAPSLRDPNARF